MRRFFGKPPVEVVKDFFTYVTLLGIVFLMCLPVVAMLGTAFKERVQAMTSASILPGRGEWHVDSFQAVIGSTAFLHSLLNTVYVAVMVTIFCILIASLAGYAISRFRGAVFSGYAVFLLLLQMFPIMLLLMPLFLIYQRLGLINSLWSVVISYTTLNLAFSIWMLKGFFDTIPRELEHAAMVDGCTRFSAWLRVVVPVSLPGIGTVAIFTFINAWNEYTLASIFLRRNEVFTATVALQQFVLQFGADWPLLMAASTIAVAPTVIFLFFAQKLLIQGMTAGAVKG